MNKLLPIICIAIFTITAKPSSGQIINTIAGNGAASSTGDGGLAGAASFNNPGGAFYDSHGNIYVVEYTGNKIRKINNIGIVSTFAGTGTAGFGGDGGPATAAMFNNPIDLISDYSGNLYITDNANQRIRKIDTFGIITTFAGNGSIGYSGDGGPATAATLHDPSRSAIDAYGNIFFADADNNVIRKINASGIITTVAGNGFAGFGGDGGPATAASLSQPLGVGFDGNGNMYIADHFNHRIRKVNTAGIISTFGGNGIAGSTGDGGPATAATIDYPNGIAVDFSCNVYFTDWSGQRVRKITPAGIISTVVGIGTAGFSGDGGSALAAQLNGPNNLTYDPTMNLYIPDYYNNRVRKIANLGEWGACPSLIPVALFTSSHSSVCQDSCIVVNSTSTSAGSIDSIRWTTIPANAVISSPSASSTNICFNNSGSYIVRLKVYGGGGVDSTSSIISVNAAPHPHISKSGGTLSVTGGPYSSYQWYNGSTPIVGATNSTYIFTAEAIYSIIVDSGGCRGISNFINTLGISFENGLQNNFWITQHNGNELTLYSSQSLDEETNVTIFDMMGKVCYTGIWKTGTTSKEIKTDILRSGFYVIRLNSRNTSLALKFFKSN